MAVKRVIRLVVSSRREGRGWKNALPSLLSGSGSRRLLPLTRSRLPPTPHWPAQMLVLAHWLYDDIH
jgi:hypothetical protein